MFSSRGSDFCSLEDLEFPRTIKGAADSRRLSDVTQNSRLHCGEEPLRCWGYLAMAAIAFVESRREWAGSSRAATRPIPAIQVGHATPRSSRSVQAKHPLTLLVMTIEEMNELLLVS